jgi:hypothetical protein
MPPPRLEIVRPSPERRSAARYKLHLPVVFSWADGHARTEDGFTVDVSTEGALVRCQFSPPLGSEVEIDVLVPSPDGNSGSVHLRCLGRVTRSLSHDLNSLFAVSGKFDNSALEGDEPRAIDSE